MISYEAYKVLHLFTLFMLISACGIVIGEGRWIPDRKFKIITVILSFFVFIGGMGLIARLGFKHSEAFPLWIWVKFLAWGVLNVIIVALFKCQTKKWKLMLGSSSVIIVFIAVFTAVTKFVK